MPQGVQSHGYEWGKAIHRQRVLLVGHVWPTCKKYSSGGGRASQRLGSGAPTGAATLPAYCLP
jgi:hypothetical protein